uniref:Ig-like domain-containing protein n=1 Tax=Pelusios castaneus TaxID=367368 RepID=A0A8C8RH06_9SAUR
LKLSSLIGPNQPITAFVDKDALLHCHVSPSMSVVGMEVRWFRASESSAIVHLYQNGRDQDAQQMPAYQGRTEMLRDGFANGSVSLRIRNIRPADDGLYTCFFQLNNVYEETMLELKVIGLGSAPHISVDSYQDGGIQLVCKSTGWYPEPKVLWRDHNGEQLPSLFERKSEKNDGLFEIQTSVIMIKKLKQNMSCTVGNPLFDQEKKASIYISDSFFLRGYPWMVALSVILVILGFFLLLASYFFWKQYTAKGKQNVNEYRVTCNFYIKFQLRPLELSQRNSLTNIHKSTQKVIALDTLL